MNISQVDRVAHYWATCRFAGQLLGLYCPASFYDLTVDARVVHVESWAEEWQCACKRSSMSSIFYLQKVKKKLILSNQLQDELQ